MRTVKLKAISIILLFIVSTMLIGIFSGCEKIYEDDTNLSDTTLSSPSGNNTLNREVTSAIDETIGVEISNNDYDISETGSDTESIGTEAISEHETTILQDEISIIDEKTLDVFETTESKSTYNPLFSPLAITNDKRIEIINAAIESNKYGSNNVDDYSIRCFGIFGDVYAVFIDSNAVVYPSMEFEEEVGGFLFKYGSTQAMLIYKDGALYRLSEAYDNSIIDTESLKLLYETYSNVKWFYYVIE